MKDEVPMGTFMKDRRSHIDLWTLFLNDIPVEFIRGTFGKGREEKKTGH